MVKDLCHFIYNWTQQFYQILKLKLKILKNQINLKFILGGVILVILAIVIYATVATYKEDPGKKQYESEIKALKEQINTLKVLLNLKQVKY